MAASPISLKGYRRGLHKAEMAILTPSANAVAYMTVDGLLARMVQRLVTVKFESSPPQLVDAHDALVEALEAYAVWCLLRDYDYPGWVMATVAQLKGHLPHTRLFMVRAMPRFQLLELPS